MLDSLAMKLDQETWTKIYPYLEEASTLAPAELDTWLERLIVEHPEIGLPLRAALVHREETGDGDFFKAPLRLPASRPTHVGQMLGLYQIEWLLGTGGMGQVWLAQRTDGRFKGRFAVKFLDQNASMRTSC